MNFMPSIGFLAVSMIGLSACETTETVSATQNLGSFERITTEGALNERVVGRQLFYKNGDFLIKKADGTWAINRGNDVLASGTWEWRGGTWCRQGQSQTGPVARNCQIIEVSQNGVRFTREDGSTGTLDFAI
jgi:hypothetical protein